jgi:hypothetical protein
MPARRRGKADALRLSLAAIKLHILDLDRYAFRVGAQPKSNLVAEKVPLGEDNT